MPDLGERPSGMVSGHNVNVRYGDEVYHVQTEDKGRSNPVIETLVYLGGRIIHHERSRYDDLAGDAYDEQAVTARLEEQHHGLVNDILRGRFAAEAKPQAFGEEYVSDRSFEQVILEALGELEQQRVVRLELVEHSGLSAGSHARLRVRALDRESGAPLAEVPVSLKLHGAFETHPRAQARTGAEGEAVLELDVPADCSHAVAVVGTFSAQGADELSLPLTQPA